MRTAIDTNILSAILSNEPLTNTFLSLLSEARREGALVISPVVWVELQAHPNATESILRSFLADGNISINFTLREQVWSEAGRRFSRYADRHRRSGHGAPKRLLADFVVGAHALLHADRLFTRDAVRYQRDFPELRLM